MSVWHGALGPRMDPGRTPHSRKLVQRCTFKSAHALATSLENLAISTQALDLQRHLRTVLKGTHASAETGRKVFSRSHARSTFTASIIRFSSPPTFELLLRTGHRGLAQEEKPPSSCCTFARPAAATKPPGAQTIFYSSGSVLCGESRPSLPFPSLPWSGPPREREVASPSGAPTLFNNPRAPFIV